MTTDEIMALVDQCIEAEKNDYLSGEGSVDYHLAALLKAVEEMAADAARYRWLREQACYEQSEIHFDLMAYTFEVLTKVHHIDFTYHGKQMPSVDAAIDAAMRKETS